MSLKQKAAQIRATGYKNSGEDSMLAHISPLEAMYLKARGGSGRTDPQTGLPHFDGGDGGDGGMGGIGGDASTAGYGGFTGDTGTGSMDGGIASGGLGDFSGMDPSMANWDAPAAYSPPSDNDQQAAVQDAVDESNPLGKYKGIINNPVLSFLSKMSPVTNMLSAPAKGIANQSTSPALGMIGGAIGAMAGPVGMALGSMAGNALGGSTAGMSPSGGNVASSPGATGSAIPSDTNNSLIGGLAGLYLANRTNANTTGQINNINSLYGPNSPYAQQLQQQLERRDAASGRRSQYGPRSVELQANLAGNAAKLAPQLQSLYTQKNNNTNLMLSTLLKNSAVNKGLNTAGSYLGNLFNPQQPGAVTGQTFDQVTNNGNFSNLGNMFSPGIGDNMGNVLGDWGG